MIPRRTALRQELQILSFFDQTDTMCFAFSYFTNCDVYRMGKENCVHSAEHDGREMLFLIRGPFTSV